MARFEGGGAEVRELREGMISPPTNVAAVEEAEGKLKDFAGKVLQWIPGEVIAFYGALTTVIVQNDESKLGESGLLILNIAGIVFAALFVLLAAFSNTSEKGWLTKRVKLRAGLAAIAFAIWSLTIPNSGWNYIDWIADNPVATASIAAFLGLIFSMFATGADKHWGGERPQE